MTAKLCELRASRRPAAEAFRYFILDQGEALLAQQFGTSAPVTG